MGYYIFSYASDLNKIKTAFNSSDEQLFENVTKTEVFKNYAEQDFKDCITTKEAIHNIIFGEPYKDNNAHVYGYAFICICDYLSQKVPHNQEMKLGYETDLVDQYLSSDFNIDLEIAETMFNDSPNFGLPKIVDWPLSGILEKDSLKNLAELFSPIEITDEEIEDLWDGNEEEDEDKACAYEHIKGFKENIAFCLENDLSLISFCH